MKQAYKSQLIFLLFQKISYFLACFLFPSPFFENSLFIVVLFSFSGKKYYKFLHLAVVLISRCIILTGVVLINKHHHFYGT